MAEPRQEPPRAPMDTSPVFLWAALILGLVVVALVAARFMGRL